MRLGSSLPASRSFSRSALRLDSSVAAGYVSQEKVRVRRDVWEPFDPGFPRGPVLVGGPQGCLLSQMNGGRIAEVFMTLSHKYFSIVFPSK